MQTKIKIRGIYSTALTKLLMDRECTIVDPSEEIQARFDLVANREPYEVLMRDRDNLQGITLEGTPEKVYEVLNIIQERLLDAVLVGFPYQKGSGDFIEAMVEFPGMAKQELDGIRSLVIPTLARHHRFRIIDPERLEQAEKTIQSHPEQKEKWEKTLFLDSILFPLQKTGAFRLEQIKIYGKPIPPREGLIQKMEDHHIVMKRIFKKGHYDGLDLPIEVGDYGLTEIREGIWYVKHAYYSKGGLLKGEYLNVNTPVELYPFGARFLDLEVDVVRRPGEKPFVVDQERLSTLAKQRLISIALESKAMEVAEKIKQNIHCYSSPQTL